MDLLINLSATTVFTCSDEITLVFPNLPREVKDKEGNHKTELPEPVFGGKVQKLASVAAGYASVSFDRHMRDQSFDAATEAKVRINDADNHIWSF